MSNRERKRARPRLEALDSRLLTASMLGANPAAAGQVVNVAKDKAPAPPPKPQPPKDTLTIVLTDVLVSSYN